MPSAKVPSRLEPSGHNCLDGKCPEGITMVPWKHGKPLIWDATFPDILAQLYRAHATRGPGAVAEMAEEMKEVKYNYLTRNYFVPVAIETLGTIGPKFLAFLKDLGRKIKHTGEEKAHHFLLQQLPVAVQRRNALAAMGAAGGSSSQDNQFLD